jgi:UDP-sugar transporter A1/2/3
MFPSIPPPSSILFKLLILLLLCVQTSFYMLLVRYSRYILRENYLISSTVLVGEMIKLIVSGLLVWRTHHQTGQTSFISHCSFVVRHSLPMSVPACLFFFQGKFNYIGLQNLESSLYSVINQGKLLTTAFFSVIFLKKQLSNRQWRALVLLAVGVFMVEMRNTCIMDKENKENVSGSVKSVHSSQSIGDRSIGLFSGLIVITFSGIAGVYLEWQLKRKSTVNGISGASFSIWDRNIQLALYGILFGLLNIYLSDDYDFILHYSLFHAYSKWTWMIISLYSFGGLMVAAVVAYTDNIIKGFANSCALILTSLVSYLWLNDLVLDSPFICGMIAVILAIFNYSDHGDGTTNNPAVATIDPRELEKVAPHLRVLLS